MRRHMLANLALLGSALAYQTPDGRIVIDEDSLETDDTPDFAGDYVDEYDDGYDFAGDYDDDEDDDLEFGRRTKDQRRGMRRLRQDQRRGRRRQRQDERRGNAGPRSDNPANAVAGADGSWIKTIVADSVTTPVAGPGVIKITPQHDFIAEDLTFDGSAAGAKVTSIFFGDRPVFSSASGIPTLVFANGGQIRDHLKGASIRGGLDITINVITANAADTVTAVVTGRKPNLGGIC